MSTYPQEPAAVHHSSDASELAEKNAVYATKTDESPALESGQEYDIQQTAAGSQRQLARSLKGRHMQMIAIGGAIGAGLFVGSGGALRSGGPAALVIGFIIIGVMLLLTMQALAELAVLYPVNGAFYHITIAFWPTGAAINVGVWITVFLVALSFIQILGIRGYGEVEFVLSIIKIAACTGFILLGIIINCGGVSTDSRGYIGGQYWQTTGAFRNGFKGFCSVFVTGEAFSLKSPHLHISPALTTVVSTASFSFGGTELTGLAAAEAKDPLKSIPRATKQVFWRITFFYVICLLIVGLIVPSDDPNLLHSSGANTQYSPFVIAINLAGIKALPSVFNVVICLSVISVANSSAFASTRTMQALALQGMAPKFLAYVDKHGRPLWCIVVQLLFGLLAFVGEASGGGGSAFFSWLLALSGLANFFIWGSICFSHIRFRAGWLAQGHSLDDLPYRATFGVIGSWVGLALNLVCLTASFYSALYPVGGSPNARAFFESYLAAPLIFALYIG
ncbi:hypothetical protein LTR08_000175 [Meristemomyces frigidus]|nr:hypothetical protein LTR08_000175 [Meristemomyces frigidus]